MNSQILKDLLRFSLLLVAVAGAGYGLHYAFVTHQHTRESLDLINFAYKFNVGITLLFTSTLILASAYLKEQLGFIFLISGMLKLGIFFFLARTLEFDLNKAVFLHFFVPYALCIVVEIIFIARILNRTNFSNDK